VADREVDFLIVGGGLAAASCASELRSRGGEGSVLLVGREPEPPYERPPISKEYLRGDAKRADAYVNEPSWYEQNGVELLTGRNVLSLDPVARTAKVQGGEEVAFGKALLGTGANVNILRVEVVAGGDGTAVDDRWSSAGTLRWRSRSWRRRFSARTPPWSSHGKPGRERVVRRSARSSSDSQTTERSGRCCQWPSACPARNPAL